ncbi:hypothetical protein DERF_014204 [Dermatophagoides farinae]|uniref:Uncharacterized protein n=1 Tax=Dermatophagoides farinae TaxID=6954 RepID=A0A922HNK8_DERFA|nr:hypothetical protein DERF_014204 [Dermatophagoides farinae]
MAITIRSLFTFDLSGPTCKIIIHYNGLYNIKCSTRERIEHNILAILLNHLTISKHSWTIVCVGISNNNNNNNSLHHQLVFVSLEQLIDRFIDRNV